MSSQDTSAETEARYDRDVTLIIAATIGCTIVAVVIVVCLGCMYYYRCVKFKHLIKPEDNTGTNTTSTNKKQSTSSTGEVHFAIEHEVEDPENRGYTAKPKLPKGKFENQVFTAKAKLPKIKSRHANVSLPLPKTEKGVRGYDVKRSRNRLSCNLVERYLSNMPKPPAQVENMYDDRAMIQYERQVAILYDHIKEEYEHYFETKRNLQGMFARRWRIRTLFRQKNRERTRSTDDTRTANTTSLNYFGSSSNIESDADEDTNNKPRECKTPKVVASAETDPDERPNNEPNELQTPEVVSDAENCSREITKVKSVICSFKDTGDEMEDKIREHYQTKEGKKRKRKNKAKRNKRNVTKRSYEENHEKEKIK